MDINFIKSKAKNYGVPIVKDNAHNLLEELVKEVKPKHILEIGTAVGYSGITMLEACSVDLITIEHNKQLVKQAKANFKSHKLGKRVKIIYDDCLVVLANMVASNKYKGYFDFIFLDGPKAQYTQMLNLLLVLLSSGGTFVADNVLFRGYVDGSNDAPTKRFKTIIKRLNEFIENCKNSTELTDFELKNIDDGIIIAKKGKNEQKQN